MATERAKRTAKIVLESKGKVSVSAAMREAGYPAATAKNPQQLTESKGWQELMEKYLPDEKLAKRHQEQLNSSRHDKLYFDIDDDDELIADVCERLGVELLFIKVNKDKTGKTVNIKKPDLFYRDLALDKAYKLKGRYVDEAPQGNTYNFFGLDFLRKARERVAEPMSVEISDGMTEPSFDDPRVKEQLRILDDWSKDVFLFCDEALDIKPARPIGKLCGTDIKYKDAFGATQTAKLFDDRGKLVYPDLSLYTKEMFEPWKDTNPRSLTWQQTIILEAYNRAIRTFDADSFDMQARWISVCSGHGIGKTASMSIIALHFLICFFGAQIGATANSKDQLQDIFLKEFYFWKDRLPGPIKADVKQLNDMVKVGEGKDWYLRARVSTVENPEALAGLHGNYVLLLADEASGLLPMTFQTMKGSLTGQNYIVMYFANPTRTEGDFYDSQKRGSRFTKLQFSSLDSPVVKPGYADMIAEDYGGASSDEYRIRVLGQFASVEEMDDKGWIPLFANIRFLFEPERGQIIARPLIACDPAGTGKDRSIIHVRDNVYLKEVLNEATSSAQDLARKIETIRDAYRSVSSDIAIDAFGVGAQVVANITTKMNEPVNALLTDKPRIGTEDQFATFRDELAWKFRGWVASGGIIVTNNPNAWLREFNGVKYKRDAQGRIHLQSKVEYRKAMGFSPDRFDAAIYTFFKDSPAQPVIIRSSDLELVENARLIRDAQGMPPNSPMMPAVTTQSTGGNSDQYSSM